MLRKNFIEEDKAIVLSKGQEVLLISWLRW
jgi:hypothetical protein